MAKSVQTLEVIAWPDLGCEAVRRLTVQDMPLTVILDAHGRGSVSGRPGGLPEPLRNSSPRLLLNAVHTKKELYPRGSTAPFALHFF